MVKACPDWGNDQDKRAMNLSLWFTLAGFDIRAEKQALAC